MIITLLTDYGSDDEFVGICHGVIARIAPEARVIDLTHGIGRHDIRHGALVLRNALDYVPLGIHVAVVDPTVGTPRRALALRCADGRVLVGPDNGLLMPAAERAGGIVLAVDITTSPHRLEPVSATFHGRDLFAPVAARLVAGAELAEAGALLDPAELVALELPRAEIHDGELLTHALIVDRFGNVTLDASHEQLAGTGLGLGRAAELAVASSRHRAIYVHAFGDVEEGGLIVYEDAYRMLAIAVNRGSAAALLGIERDAEVRLRPL